MNHFFFNVPLSHTFQDHVDTSGFYTQSFGKTLSYLINQAYSCSGTKTHKHSHTFSLNQSLYLFLSNFPEDFFLFFINFELPSIVSLTRGSVSLFISHGNKCDWDFYIYVHIYKMNIFFVYHFTLKN